MHRYTYIPYKHFTMTALEKNILKSLSFSGSLTETALATPLQAVEWSPLASRNISLFIKRDDLLHPGISGNKFYKLYHHLQQAQMNDTSTIVSFGGAYSNHLHALSICGKLLGLQTVGVIRGEKPKRLSPTLVDAQLAGMQLHFVSREQYRRRHNPEWLKELMLRFAPCMVVPEGGGGLLGAKGCMDIASSINQQLPGGYDAICVACGTGTTLAGLIAAAQPKASVYGYSALKGEDTLTQEVSTLVGQLGAQQAQWQIFTEYHCGGYAKLPDYLVKFMHIFETETGIQLDPVYTAKLFWGIAQQAEAGFWSEGSTVVAVHTGGLQGRRGYPVFTSAD
jgi:1-aminocyclopropane-1-carboxylate deaminase/D-cysteine desulfhydrase-like pyridoxal-dependent ACC family enzyme